ncbi:hypothetical protein [Streptomyces sp. SMS_SU21]|uniref:hypothetical protein n=1 Tax=Streptomyces sp. SMS_SU21 TaxID=2069440 RepID=UPI000C87FB53|nr:hypothetical protein [Streptomyces sp. SMS_SU21]MCA2202396.1 hypothetical protein [Streptomyces sp. SMS_SU21]NEA96528.1 hypothetical protein [Actinospica acidiphila]
MPLVPWTEAAACTSATPGAATTAYAAHAFLNQVGVITVVICDQFGVITAVICGYTGFGIARRKPVPRAAEEPLWAVA